jgi:hypothetical protein
MVVLLIYKSAYSFNDNIPKSILQPYGMNGSNQTDLSIICGFRDASQFKYVYIVNITKLYWDKCCLLIQITYLIFIIQIY